MFKKFLRKKYIIPAIIVLVFGVAVFARPNASAPEEETQTISKQVQVQEILPQDEVTTRLTASGTVVPKEYSLIRSLTPGTVEYLAPVGAAIQRGEPLFSIRDTNIESNYTNALEHYRQTQAITSQQVDQANLALSSAEARLSLATRSLETAERQTEQSLATSQNSAVNAYTTAYSVMEQALNFISVGNLDNFNNYRYLNLDRAPSQLRANAEVQHLKAVAAFQKVSATPDRTNLLSALSQLSDATREIQRAIDLTVSVLQAATQLEFDAALTADRTQVLSYQSQLNQAASATISATNALNAALTGNDLQIDQASNAVELGQIEFNNATIAVANAERNAQLQITSAQSQLNAAGYQSNNLHLPSPFSGTILSHFVKVGEQIQIGTQLIELGNLAIFELPVSVDVEFAQTLQVGNEVFINDTIPGVITAIEPTGSVSSGKVGVTVQTTDAQDRLTAGQVASVTLELRRALANQIVIPIRAATIEVSGTTVLVIEDGQAVKRSITLGQVFGNQVVVTGGLATGDKLILPDGVFVSAGDSVEVIE